MKRSRRSPPLPAAFRPDEAGESSSALPDSSAVGGVRIIGGTLRGRVLPFGGDPHIRPMKDRIREAVFNLLADRVRERLVIDLFAGTGALGFEAISRGSAAAVLLERHFPTAKNIRRHAELLGVAERVEVEAADTFVWVRRLVEGLLTGPDGRPRDLLARLVTRPWLVFCSPPYSLYVERTDDLLTMLQQLLDQAPPGSLFVVESDERFDPQLLPDPDQWQLRFYPPALILMRTKFPPAADPSNELDGSSDTVTPESE